MSKLSAVRTIGASVVAVSIVLAGAVIPAAAAAASTGSGGAYTVTKLADSTAGQQRWLSLPKSRITLNPGRDVAPSATGTLNTAYFAGGSQQLADNVVTNGLSSGAPAAQAIPAIDEGDPSPAFSDQFTSSSIGSWSTSNDATLAAGGAVTLNSNAANPWGSVGHAVSVNVSKDPVLLVQVSSVSGPGTKWSVTLGDGGNRNVATLQANTSKTGTYAYDLSSVGTAFDSVQLWVNGTKGSAAATFAGVSIHAAPPWAENFDSTKDVANWAAIASNGGNGATIAYAPDTSLNPPATASSTGTDNTDGALVTSTSSQNWGSVSRLVTVNLTTDPILTIGVAGLGTGDTWTLKIADTSGTDLALVGTNNNSATGLFSYDVAGLGGLNGQQTFRLKLYSSGPAPSTVQLTRLSFAATASPWIQTATSATNTWNPQSLDYTGTYGSSGTYTTQDAFLDTNSFARIVAPSLTNGSPTLYGQVAGTPSWNASAHVLTETSSAYTSAVAFPAGASVYFFAGTSASGAQAPASAAQSWAVVLPSAAPSSVGFGFGVGSDAATAQQGAQNGASYAAASAALQSDVTFWNGILLKVPAAQNFSLNQVPAQGVSDSQIEATYYDAFVSLEMEVLPATPENGSTHAQMPVGKADTYYSPGFTHNTLSAFWDGPLALQELAYIDPSTAWDIFEGMMSAVVNDPGQADNGQFGTASEALPARIAQTAWILYSVTGDKSALESIYPALQRFLGWSLQHPQWNNTSHYPNQTYPDGTHATWQDERDDEYVVSLAVDEGYVQSIATVLGKTADVATYKTAQQTLEQEYAQWFFPNGNAAEFYWVHLGLAGGWPQSAGDTPDAVLTGLLMPGLTDSQEAAVMKVFNSVYDTSAQFAGIATETAGLKAPDEQYMVDGLITTGHAADAAGIVQAVVRDETTAHIFSENYNASSSGPVGNGERPSTFGISQFIDDIWLMNGYSLDEGTPSFVKLPGASGGVNGLTYLGKSYNATVMSSGVQINGDAAAQPGVCTSYATTGQLQTWSTQCAKVSLSSATVNPGQHLTVSVTGLPAATQATVELHSTPVQLGSAVTGASGTLSLEVTIPSGIVAGSHTIVVAAGDVGGSAPLTVLAATGSGAGGGSSARPSSTATAQSGLAYTGSDVAGWVTAALLLLLVGAGMSVVGIRTRKARRDTTL